jgi:hypothetical protein
VAWFKVDDRYWSHPKVMCLTTSARGVWLSAGSWAAAYLTDGHVPSRILFAIIPEPRSKVMAAASELVAAGLWTVVDDGWQFHDWDDYQPTKEMVDAVRHADAERKRRGRDTQRTLRSMPPHP